MRSFTSSRAIPATWPTRAGVSAAYWRAARQQHIEGRSGAPSRGNRRTYHGSLFEARNGRGRDQGRRRQVAPDCGIHPRPGRGTKDAAIRELSEKFDKWSPKDFHLSLRGRTRHRAGAEAGYRDIKFAQAQVRNFAQKQRDTMLDLEVETLPGVVLGHRHIPVNSIGCYVPGGRYPMPARMSIVTAKVASKGTACAPLFKGGPHPAIVAAMYSAAPTIFMYWAACGSCRHGARHGSIKSVDMIVGPGNAYVAEANGNYWPCRHRPARADRTLIIADDTVDGEICATDLLGQAEHGPTSPPSSSPPGKARARHDERGGAAAEDPAEADLAGHAWKDYGEVIVCDDEGEMIVEADRVASEHVQVMTRDRRLSQRHEKLRLAVPRAAHQCRLWRQGDRHQPHATDQEKCAFHRRTMGRQIHQDLHLPEGADRRGQRQDRRSVLAALRAGRLPGACRAGECACAATAAATCHTRRRRNDRRSDQDAFVPPRRQARW